MMRNDDNNLKKFYVVQFIELPFKGINNYVCVPYSWLIVPKAINQKIAVSYPNNENPFVTKNRVKSNERYNDDWKFYMAMIKYESDSYAGAELWITTRNNYRPSVEKKLRPTDTEKKFPLNKKLRMSNRNHSLKLKDNSRKLLPRVSIKRPALPESNKQLDGKLMKLDEAAQSSSAIVIDDNAKPGSSRQEQLIIAQDNQPMKSVQTESTASDSNSTSSSSQQKDENLQELLPIEEQQELIMPSIDLDTSTFFINDDEEVQLTSIEPSYQAILQFTKQSKSVQQPQIVTAPSIEMTPNLFKMQIEVMNIKRNLEIEAYNLSNLMGQTGSLRTSSVEEQSSVITQNQSQDSAQLQEMRSRESTALHYNMAISSQEINDIPRINLKKSPNVNMVDSPKNVQSFTNVSSALQSRLSSSLTHPSYAQQLLDRRRSLSNQQQSPTQCHQNHDRLTNQNNFEQDLLKKSADSNNYEQQPNSRTINMSALSIGQNSIIPTSPLYQTFELPQQRHSQPFQGVMKKTPSPILTKVLNSIPQALSTTDNQYLLNEQQFQENYSKYAFNENDLNEIEKILQIDEWKKEKTPSANHGANSDFDSITDHVVPLNHEMSADEAPIEKTNNFHDTGTSCADKPIVAENSTNNQTPSKVILAQQMSDNFADIFTQIDSNLRYTIYMQNNLQSSILEIAQTYKNLSNTVEQFNSMQNVVSNESFSINLKLEVQQSPEERHTVTSTSSSTQNQHSYDDANNPLKKKYNNSRRFVLPPEYNPHNSKWTLKYQTNLPGVVELMPRSGVYISYANFIYCQQVSKDCKLLARRLLLAIFNKKALSVCLSMTEKARDSVESNIRPKLDHNASLVLLNFVLKHGLQRGWNTDLQPILSTLHNKIQEMRFKYGLVLQS